MMVNQSTIFLKKSMTHAHIHSINIFFVKTQYKELTFTNIIHWELIFPKLSPTAKI